MHDPLYVEEKDLPVEEGTEDIQEICQEFGATLERPQTPDISYIDWLSSSYRTAVSDNLDLDENEEEMESVVDEAEEWEDGNLPVYTGAPIRLIESLVSILTLALTFSLSGQVIHSILKHVSLHLPAAGNVFKKSLFMFKKFFSKIRGSFDYECYCSTCYGKCDKTVGCLEGHTSPLCCLVKLPLIPQLQTMFKRRKFFDKIIPLASRFCPEGLSDIFDGKL